MTLSDKIVIPLKALNMINVKIDSHIKVKDVREFIKKFKKKVKARENYLEKEYSYEDTIMSSKEVIEIFDKEAGDELM